MLKEGNMKKDRKAVQPEQKQLTHLQILTNKILRMQQTDNGNFKKSSHFLLKKSKYLYL